MIATALALAAILTGPVPVLPDRPAQVVGAPGEIPVLRPALGSVLRAALRPAPRPVPMEMTPAPGRWEVEDAPAYFSNRRAFPQETARDISTAVAAAGSGVPDRRSDGSASARPAEDGRHDIALAREVRGAVVPLPRPRDLAAPAARPRP